MIVTGYFDASGKHPESNALAVSGFLARPDEWAAFEVEWEAALRGWGIDAFHMSDFVGRRGAFADWSEDLGRERLGTLLRTINRHVLGSAGIVIPHELYDRHFSERAEMLSGGPYSLAGLMLFREVVDLVAPLLPDAEIAYVYEQGDEGAGQFLKVFQDNYRDPEQRAKFRLLSLRFEDKKRFVPLQAADILAYEMYRDIDRYMGLTDRSRRYPLVHFYAKPNAWSVVGEENIKMQAEVVELGIEHSLGTWNKSKLTPRSGRRSRRKSTHDR